MIRRLQLKIIAAVLGTLLLVFAAVLLVLNLSVYQTSRRRAEGFLSFVAENDGFHLPPRDTPQPMPAGGRRPGPLSSPEMMRAGRFFYVKVDQSGNIIESNFEMMFDFSADNALRYITTALNSGRAKGNIESLSYLAAAKPYGRILVFVERSIDLLLLEQLNRTSLWAAGIVCPVLLCLAFFLAKWIVSPVKTSFIKQRRFISDAGHELKTPLTIISVNADVLQNEIGANRHLTQIKAQSERMNGLVHDLLSLAKADEEQASIVMSKGSLSSAVLSAALEFESRAFEDGKSYSYDIAENIIYIGDEKQIRQLMSILIDNALTYSDAAGQINVSLSKDGNHSKISVFNTGIGVPDAERDKIFERFYRIDESRSRETGGYGIGLSIAKAITEAHKGKIIITGEYQKWIRFDVVL